MQENHPEITTIWLTQEDEVVDNLHCQRFYYKYSFKGIYYSLFARKFIYATGSTDISALVPKYGRESYQLWHGWPIKKLGLMSPETYPSANNAIRSIVSRLLVYRFNQYKIIFCHDKITQEILSKAFSIPTEKCVITGWPRFDRNRVSSLQSNSCLSEKKLILFAPTWHSDDSTQKNIDELTGATFSSFLQSNNYQLVIKLHPLERGIKCISSPNVRFLKESETIESHLRSSAIFISDFSSLLVDASINKDVYLFGKKLEEYKLNRGINEQYLTIYNNYFNFNANQLISAINNNKCIHFPVSLKDDTCLNIIELIKRT